MRVSSIRFSVVLVGVLMLAAPAVAGEERAGPEEATHDGTVNATRGDPITPVFLGRVADGEKARVPDMPPLHLIPPMPMPDIADLEKNAGTDRTSVVYNAETGETFHLPDSESAEITSGFGEGYSGAFDAVLGNLELTKGLGTMSEISNVSADPWRKNVKLFMKYNTTSGGTAWYVCSGSMRDAEVVLTASHCVYSREPNIMNWAAEIWVYPGWDGAGSWGSAGDADTFGYGYGNWYQASNAWTDSGDYTYDVALIRINRAVGMLTGWFAWAYGFDCATVQGRTMHNSSYPAEDCGTTGLHNGRDMYYWYGSVDDCSPTNRFHIDTTPGCFTALWGGQSGSAMYYIVDSSRYAEAVASTSNRSTDGYYARLWETFVNDMNNSFIPDARGSTMDIQALQMRTSPTTITAGQAFTSSNFFTTNPTNNNPALAAYVFDLRLSSNDYLSTGDTLIASNWSYNWDYGSMSSVSINTGAFTMPLNTPSGTYWLGALLDPATDGVSSNNNTHYWDAQQLTVNGVADLRADWLSAPSSAFNVFDTMDLSYNIDNLGGDPSNTITVDVRASTNTTISTLDTPLGIYTLGGLTGGNTTTQYPTVTIPATMSGSYYIGMIVTANDDVNGTNNTTYDATPIWVVPTVFADGFESGSIGYWSSSAP